MPDAVLVKEVEEQFTSALAAYRAKPTLITEHANHEESIRTGGYASRTLLELVQNAADATVGESSDGGMGRVEIVLDLQSKVLYCANSGRPFSKSGLTAITHAHLSGKRGDEIGRFGLGFKSVLAVSDSPQILSRSVSFEFNSELAKRQIREIGPVRHLPVLRTATLLNASELIGSDPVLEDLSAWATTIIRLPNVQNLDRLRSEMMTFSSEFLLFVGAVREVRLRVIGDGGFATSHVSRELGGGRFKIERPDGSGDEWFVGERMHAPSVEARREVGEAVSRDQIKVSVALPLRPRRANPETGDAGTQVGQFWSYFPLQDKTSATAFFNAPWSVNDDRTTLLRNRYNREILESLANIFVQLLPKLSSSEDPALHLDYLPARGREVNYFGDEILCSVVPTLAAAANVIPDGAGKLSRPGVLKPLDFLCEWNVPDIAHRSWIESPNTKNDVPHWRCYSSSQRVARLRQLFAVSVDRGKYADNERDMKKALVLVPKRGVQYWPREWAEGNDSASSANALKLVMANRGVQGADTARVVPTNGGLRSMGESSQVFLAQADDLEIDGAVFVTPEFLAYPDVEKTLRIAGFRDLDPIAIFTARLNRLKSDATPDLYEKFWDSALSVSAVDARRIIRTTRGAQVLVPTRDGKWRWPQQVLDLDADLSEANGHMQLDRRRCLTELARDLGVAHVPRKDFSFEDEALASAYETWVLAELNSKLTRGERPIERISLFPVRDNSPGPFSALLLLKDAGASDQVRESWTRGLLDFGDQPWDCEDTAAGTSHRVKSPVRWAVDQAGVLRSSLGYRSPGDLVAPSLLQYRDLLPLFEGPRAVADSLDLPDELSLIPVRILRDGLAVDLLPPNFPDDVLTGFIIAATQLAYAGAFPPKIPARVGRIVESCPARSVFVAVDEEQRKYLTDHHRPFLMASEEQAARLVAEVGCLRFEDTFAFSIHVEGRQEPERLLDVFTGARDWPGAHE